MRIELNEAVRLLKSGGITAIPTETVYGLAASLAHPKAIKHLFQIKKRPPSNPLIIHLSDSKQILDFHPQIEESFFLLAQRFWPGPLTLVLEVNSELISAEVRAGLSTAAFRVPNHPLALAVLQRTGPLVMPSANLSGKPSATNYLHVETDFGLDFPVLDGGECQKGLESTVMIMRNGKWVIIRQGILSPEAFQDTLDYIPSILVPLGEKPICPGQMFRHYAPQARLKLVNRVPDDWKGVILGFTEREYPQGYRLIILGDLKVPNTLAERLYGLLRQLDDEGVDEVCVDVDFPKEGILGTVHERLKKASQGH
jgi:L-threonylcarbamoyladenylate synthase